MRTAVLAILVACVLALTAPPALADVPPIPTPRPPTPFWADRRIVVGILWALATLAVGIWAGRRTRRQLSRPNDHR